MITDRDRKWVLFFMRLGIWKPYCSIFRLPEVRTCWGTEWIYERMLKRQARDDAHHAPACPANHYCYRRLVFHRCTCGAHAFRERATDELLADYADLLNAHGPDSDECQQFLHRHRRNSELLELAEMSRRLKKAIQARAQREGGVS